MERHEVLLKEGVALGMCSKFRDTWGTPNTAELAQKMFAGMDFCIEHDYPKLSLLQQLFTPQETELYGIYIADGTSRGQLEVCVLGDANVNVYVPAYGVCEVYARHNSKVHLHLGEKAFCYVTILDNARVFTETKASSARLKASYFGGHIINTDMFDTIHDKTKKEA
jgi:hypothetical protein